MFQRTQIEVSSSKSCHGWLVQFYEENITSLFRGGIVRVWSHNFDCHNFENFDNHNFENCDNQKVIILKLWQKVTLLSQFRNYDFGPELRLTKTRKLCSPHKTVTIISGNFVMMKFWFACAETFARHHDSTLDRITKLPSRHRFALLRVTFKLLSLAYDLAHSRIAT